VQLFLILKYLHGHLLFLRMSMIYASDHNAESTTAELLHDFVPVLDLIGLLIQEVTVFRIEAIVEDLLTVNDLGWRILMLRAVTLLTDGQGLWMLCYGDRKGFRVV
jgi:hypothetical protein